MKSALATLILLLLALPIAAEDRGGLPQPAPGNVTLTLDEFNRLSELASKPVKPPDVPPQPYSLKQAEIKLNAGSESVSGTIQFRGEVLKKGIARVPLTKGLTILNAQQDGKELPLQLESGTESAILSGPSEFSFSLNVGQPLALEAGRASLSLPVPSAGSVTLSLVVPGEYTSVQVSHGLITSRTSQNGHTTVLATLVPGTVSSIWWTTRETPAVAPAAREVRFLSEVKTLLSVSENDLTAAVLADLTVVQGEPSQFEVVIPSGYEVTGVTGSTLDSTEQKGDVLTLKLAGASQKTYEFLISLNKPLTDTKASAPLVEFKNTQRETGEVLVESTGSTEINAAEGGSMKRMDVKEVNPSLRSLARFPAQAAFRYHRQPNETPTLALDWVRFPDTTVLAAIAEDAEVTTLVTSEGKSLTEVKLTVKNQAQPFLKVDLPGGASILSADVSGEKVKPVEAPDGNRVPLLRAGFRSNGPYSVSFVFMHSGAPFSKKGDSSLSLPGMDIPINILRWEVFLPEQFKVKDFSGDVISADRVPAPFVEPVEMISFNGAPAQYHGQAFERLGANFGGPIKYPIQSLIPGQIGGLVMDMTGAVVPGAQVRVTSQVTGSRMDATSDSNGLWRVWSVPSGGVTVEVSSPGFKVWQQRFMFDSLRSQEVDAQLQVGAVSETVEVQASTLQAPIAKMEEEAKLQAQIAQNTPSQNVVNLQRRVAGVLPIAVDVPHSGTAFHFVRPLVVNEETKVSFNYKSK